MGKGCVTSAKRVSAQEANLLVDQIVLMCLFLEADHTQDKIVIELSIFQIKMVNINYLVKSAN